MKSTTNNVFGKDETDTITVTADDIEIIETDISALELKTQHQNADATHTNFQNEMKFLGGSGFDGIIDNAGDIFEVKTTEGNIISFNNTYKYIGIGDYAYKTAILSDILQTNSIEVSSNANPFAMNIGNGTSPFGGLYVNTIDLRTVSGAPWNEPDIKPKLTIDGSYGNPNQILMTNGSNEISWSNVPYDMIIFTVLRPYNNYHNWRKSKF